MEDVRSKNGVAGGCGGQTSAASRILSRWAARQACEQMMLTTLDLERRNRESELLALARLHTVSMLDASFLRADADGGGGDGSSREQSPELGEAERARVRRIAREWTAQSSPRSEGPRGEEWLGETERERVRSVREHVQMASQGERPAPVLASEHQRAMRGREAPRLRGRQARVDVVMRMARERQRELQGLSEHCAVSAFAHRGRIQSFLRGRFLRSGRTLPDERPFSLAGRELGRLRQIPPVSSLREEVHFRAENVTRGQARNGSEASGIENNMIVPRNGQSLLGHNTNGSSSNQHYNFLPEISNGNHHNSDANIQNLVPVALQSMEGEAVETESNVTNGNTALQNEFAEEQMQHEGEHSGHREQERQQSDHDSSNQSDNGMQEESEMDWQQINERWSQEIPDSEDGEDGPFLETNEEWHVHDSREASSNWQHRMAGPQTSQHFASSRRVNRFSPPDDDDVYGMELRELLSRRSVSNLLSSGFRESLDQLIQSYVQRQEHAPLNWDFDRPMQNAALLEEGGDEHRTNELNQAEHDTISQTAIVLPPPPPPPQRLWQPELPRNNWNQQSMHRMELDWDIIHVLRDEMAGLQQGMTSMQQMLEACMEMQIELQRSVRQEVSAALNRSLGLQGIAEETSEDGSQWRLASKGTCCVCCDSHIDSLLYRCGHMCTCSKCASELLRDVGKCPLCRAPIVEVIRAYCIL